MAVVVTFDTRPEDSAIPTLTVHDSVSYRINSDDLMKARELLTAGRKIDAIKELRAATGFGLKNAKEIVEHIEQHTPKLKAWYQVQIEGGRNHGVVLATVFTSKIEAEELALNMSKSSEPYHQLLSCAGLVVKKKW